MPVSISNFREDLGVNGSISNADVDVVKAAAAISCRRRGALGQLIYLD